jgi:tRNA1Val (adenine37-N6)-methyltransferase
MGRNNYFQFKQFLVLQEKAAMKVGTDGVLLGAWVEVQNERKILDIGTGTGVIALMMAQRTAALITGVEIEKLAAEEATQNCLNSPWTERLTIKNCSFQEFAKNSAEHFDLIISNPPFFVNDKKSAKDNLAVAKHSHLLPFDDLVNGTAKLLHSGGRLAVILPVIQAKQFIEKAQYMAMHIIRLTEVKPTPHKATNRYLMEFSKTKTALKTDCLSIFDIPGQFSKPYKQLTQNFYLNF